MRLYALRGAINVEHDDREEILQATAELMGDIAERNGLTPEMAVSCIFTCTADLSAEFPAVAARSVGFDRVPLLCTQEIPVPGSMPMVIRVLLHYYAGEEHEPTHVYLRDTRSLRADLHAAQ